MAKTAKEAALERKLEQDKQSAEEKLKGAEQAKQSAPESK